MQEASDVPWYYRTLDFDSLWKQFPPPPNYFDSVYLASRDEIRANQNARLKQQVARAWEISFYRRHWRRIGIEPEDIQTVDDLSKVPPFSVSDLRESIERCPPFGDYMGFNPKVDPPMPLVMQTSGGTTGLPRPMLYSPRDREIMGILGGRRLFMHGIRAGDLVQVVHSLGLSNAGLSTREAIWKYSGAIPVMAGSGAVTPTRRQIEIIKGWDVRAVVGFFAYLRHMGQVARDELGIDPKELGVRILSTHLGGDDRKATEDLWNAKVYDTYGANEAGIIAAECSHQSGMHIFEDAHYIEIVDADSGAAVPEGKQGTIYITCLFKHLAPMIRFNINDVSAFVPGRCACGSTHRRLQGIFGRSDNMVKIRGVNVYPDAIGAVVTEFSAMTGEYICIVEAADEMAVFAEVGDAAANKSDLTKKLETRLKEVIGVKIITRLVERGTLDQYTGLSQTSKIKRLIDKRKLKTGELIPD